MLAVGLIWGATNAAMRRGALLWDRYLKSSPNSGDPPRKFYQKLLNSLSNWLTLLLFWQYSIPFFINLSASATFFAILGQAPISLAVPVTNATTFAATAVSGILLGEETRIGHTLLGTGFIVLGVSLCITWSACAFLLGLFWYCIWLNTRSHYLFYLSFLKQNLELKFSFGC